MNHIVTAIVEVIVLCIGMDIPSGTKPYYGYLQLLGSALSIVYAVTVATVRTSTQRSFHSPFALQEVLVSVHSLYLPTPLKSPMPTVSTDPPPHFRPPQEHPAARFVAKPPAWTTPGSLLRLQSRRECSMLFGS